MKEIIINRPAMSTQSKMFDDIPGTYMIVKGKCESKTAFFFLLFDFRSVFFLFFLLLFLIFFLPLGML